jgi:streptogramin lyase
MMIPTLLLLLASQAGGPVIDNLEIASYQGGLIEIHGHGFGAPTPTSSLLFRSGSQSKSIPSNSPKILLWNDHVIHMALKENTPSGKLRVSNAAGISAAANIEVFAYDWFNIAPTPGTNASPLSIAVDNAQRVWVNQEFQLNFQRLDLSTGVVTGLDTPKPPGPGPFASTIFSDHQSQTSVLGEGVMVDPLGRIWFTQGGGSLYGGIHENHSRIVCVLPDAPGGLEFRVYNVPNDWNEVIGLTWDPTRNWVWFAQGSLSQGSRIVGFDPELIPWDNQFDFSTSLQHQVGEPGLPSDPVFHFFDVPNPGAFASHLIVKSNGDIWFTHFWGSAIGRLQPFTGGMTTYPVPAAISLSLPSIFVGAGPWQILEDPNGDIVFNEFFDSTITRFDISRADDPLTMQLDVNGLNPGMTDRVVPRFNRRREALHSIAYDLEGRLWYTLHTENETGLDASVGYLTPDWRHMTRFSPMDKTAGVGAWSAAGIALEPISGDLFLAEFWRKRIGRLKQVSELP